MWVLTCLAGFFITIVLHYLFSNKLNAEERYRNNMKKIIREFKNHFLSIFNYY
jgi:beta-lactamase regulating signal transducer with metallopeptidase domain